MSDHSTIGFPSSHDNGTKSIDSKSTAEELPFGATPFQDHVTVNRLSNKPVRISKNFGLWDEEKQKAMFKKTGLRNNQLLYLTASENILEYDTMNQSADVILKKRRFEDSPEFKKQKFDSIKDKLNQNRNPNVTNILKDIANETESPVQALKNKLLNEYNRFIEASTMNYTRPQSKKNDKPVGNKEPDSERLEWTFLTQVDDQKKPMSDEQMDLIALKMKMMFNERLERSDSRTSSRATLVSENIDFERNNNERSLSEIHNKLDSIDSAADMQIALISTDPNEPAQQLRTMLNEIEQIYLPTFQPQLHQICQYGKSYDLVKLITNVRILVACRSTKCD
jgi:hypothetical protein